MVFSTTNLFKSIACPEGPACFLTNCIYSHDGANSAQRDSSSSRPQIVGYPQTNGRGADYPSHHTDEPPHKKRKVTYESLAEKPPSRADLIRTQLAASRTSTKPSDCAVLQQQSVDAPSSKSQAPASLVKAVTPPPPAKGKVVTFGGHTDVNNGSSAVTSSNSATPVKAPVQEVKVEALNPRLIANDPAGHSKRSFYLKHLHTEIVQLNQKCSQAPSKPGQRVLVLNAQQLIRLALDEEEKIAREQSALYPNVVKQRISALRKMNVEGWSDHVRELRKLESGTANPPKGETPIITGLTPDEEILILPHLVADQSGLSAFGYIPDPPTEAAAAEAAAAVEASRNYEMCARCEARFQNFPGRNAMGQITSNGPCKYHPGRRLMPPRKKTDRETGYTEVVWDCCKEPMGTVGCTRSEDHVFKINDPARMAAVLAFATTPENPKPKPDRQGKPVRAVTFDCEMGHTDRGMELIRLTAITWPAGRPLIDALVRPLGIIIDLNSRFSGVLPEHYDQALPYAQWEQLQTTNANTTPPLPSPLPLLPSPQAARALLCTFLTPRTPLIGHAIENDLNIIRLCHPTIIDTVLLYPRGRGLPERNGLRALTQRHLHRFIQTGGERGHDSLEDALATGDLVRLKVRDTWRQLRASGWVVRNGMLVGPGDREELDTKEVSSREGGEVKRSSSLKRKAEEAVGVAE